MEPYKSFSGYSVVIVEVGDQYLVVDDVPHHEGRARFSCTKDISEQLAGCSGVYHVRGDAYYKSDGLSLITMHVCHAEPVKTFGSFDEALDSLAKAGQELRKEFQPSGWDNMTFAEIQAAVAEMRGDD